jgi:hypothetical protein
MALGTIRAIRQPVSFTDRTELVRYIDVDQRLNGNRPAPVAFLANPGQSHLSVNSLAIESMKEIATYYAVALQSGASPVAVGKHKLASYNDAARKGGVMLRYDGDSSGWVFLDADDTTKPAYRHRPVSSTGDRPGSSSHCGFECVRVLDELNAHKVARRLAQAKFHLISI